MNHQWQERNRPARLERRYTFRDYPALRKFLELAAELSEREDLYPDMGFGWDYVNLTLHAGEGEARPGRQQHRLALQLDRLASESGH